MVPMEESAAGIGRRYSPRAFISCLLIPFIFSGSACRKLMIWNCATGAKLCETDTENQVSGTHWNQNYRELITGHGYPNNVLKIWKYPKFTHITVSQHYALLEYAIYIVSRFRLLKWECSLEASYYQLYMVNTFPIGPGRTRRAHYLDSHVTLLPNGRFPSRRRNVTNLAML